MARPVKRVRNTGHTGNHTTATFEVNRAGNGDHVPHVTVQRLALVEQAEQPSHAPTHERHRFHARVTAHFSNGLAHHVVGVISKVQVPMFLARLTPIDKVDPESGGDHVLHETALRQQVKGFCGHAQRRHNDQWHGMLLALDRHHCAIGQFDFILVGQLVVPHRHQVAVIDQFKPGAAGLDQRVTLKQPVRGVGRNLGQLTVCQQPPCQCLLDQLIHAAAPVAASSASSSSTALPVYTASRCRWGSVSRAPVKPIFKVPA